MVKLIKRGKRLGLAMVSCALILALAASATIPQVAKAEPGEKIVKIAYHGVYTGALASTGVWVGNGMKDCIRYLNEQGYIPGVRLEFTWQETGGLIPRHITAHKRFKEAGVMAEVSIIGDAAEVLSETLQRDEIPFVVLTYFTEAMVTRPVPWIFSPDATFGDNAAAGLKWFRDQWTEERRPRVGGFGYEHRAYYEFLDGVKWACEQYDMEFVGYEVVPLLGAIDTSTEWLRLAGKKPDVITGVTCGATQVVAMKDAQRLEIQERGITLFDGGYCVAATLHTTRTAANGWYLCVYGAYANPCVSRAPLLKTIFEVREKYRGIGQQELMLDAYMGPWPGVMLIAEGIRLAAEKVGVDNLSGATIRDGIVSVKDLDMGGLMRPITMSNVKPWYGNGFVLFQVRDCMPYPVLEDWWLDYPGFYKTRNYY